jgi:transposase
MKTDLTDKQRQALSMSSVRVALGMRLNDYARARGVGIRSIYDSMVALRKKGLLTQPMTRGESAFVAVRVKAVTKARETSR